MAHLRCGALWCMLERWENAVTTGGTEEDALVCDTKAVVRWMPFALLSDLWGRLEFCVLNGRKICASTASPVFGGGSALVLLTGDVTAAVA